MRTIFIESHTIWRVICKVQNGIKMILWRSVQTMILCEGWQSLDFRGQVCHGLMYVCILDISIFRKWCAFRISNFWTTSFWIIFTITKAVINTVIIEFDIHRLTTCFIFSFSDQCKVFSSFVESKTTSNFSFFSRNCDSYVTAGANTCSWGESVVSFDCTYILLS